jgi:hypothetical protein
MSVVAVVPAWAQSAASAGEFSISPVNERLNAAPEESHVSKVTVKNTSNRVLEFTLTEIKFKMGMDGKIGLSDEPKLDWLRVANNKITIKPGKSQEVTVNLKVPKGTSSGPYFPALLFESKSEKVAKNQTGTGVGVSVAFVFGVNVLSGYPTTSVKVTELSVTNPVLESKATISYSITNIVNAFTKPSARLQVLNGEGIQVYEEVINAELNTLAPGQVLSGQVNLDKEQLSQLGQYKVQLLVLDEQFDTANLAETNFWVISLDILVAIIVGSVVVLILILAAGFFIVGKFRKQKPAAPDYK